MVRLFGVRPPPTPFETQRKKPRMPIIPARKSCASKASLRALHLCFGKNCGSDGKCSSDQPRDENVDPRSGRKKTRTCRILLIGTKRRSKRQLENTADGSMREELRSAVSRLRRGPLTLQPRSPHLRSFDFLPRRLWRSSDNCLQRQTRIFYRRAHRICLSGITRVDVSG